MSLHHLMYSPSLRSSVLQKAFNAFHYQSVSSQHDSTTKYNTSDCIQIWRRTRATLPYYSMFKHHGGYCKTTLHSSAHSHNLHYNSVLAVQSGTHREQETGCPFVHSSVLNFVQAHFGWQVSLQFCFYPLTLNRESRLVFTPGHS